MRQQRGAFSSSSDVSGDVAESRTCAVAGAAAGAAADAAADAFAAGVAAAARDAFCPVQVLDAWILSGELPFYTAARAERLRDTLEALEWHRGAKNRQNLNFKRERLLCSCKDIEEAQKVLKDNDWKMPAAALQDLLSTMVCLFDFAEALPLGHGPTERDERFRGMGALGIFGATFYLPGGLVVKVDVGGETPDTSAAAAICALDKALAQLRVFAESNNNDDNNNDNNNGNSNNNIIRITKMTIL